jgi:TIGR03009 family protein
MIHRREIVSCSVLAFAICGGWLPAPAMAQGQAGRAQLQPQAQAQQPRPQVQPESQPQIENIEVSPAVQQLLEFWEAKSSEVNQLYGEFDRYSYDSDFGVEKRGQGRLWFEAPDKGRIDITPSDDVPTEPNNINPDKLRADGQPFQILPDNNERWICNGERVFAINDDDRTYAELSIPPQFQGENIIDSPLPFLFGMQAERAKQRYIIEIGPMHNPDGRIEGAALNVHVIVRPRWEQDAREWTTAEILLNPDTFLPNAVRITGGTHEEVYVFRSVAPALRGVGLFNPDAFNDRPPQHYQCQERQTAGAPQPITLERSASLPPQ